MSGAIIFGWCAGNFFYWIVFSHKPHEFDAFGVTMLAWQTWPIILTIALIMCYSERKKYKWLKQKWALIALSGTWKYLTQDAGKNIPGK